MGEHEKSTQIDPKSAGENYYEILGVSPDATVDEIGWFYRSLISKTRPDTIMAMKEHMEEQHLRRPSLLNDFAWRLNQAEQKTKLLNEAYQALLSRAQLVNKNQSSTNPEANQNLEDWIVPDIDEWKQIRSPEMKLVIRMLATMPKYQLTLEFLRVNWDILDDLVREGKVTEEESDFWLKRMATKAEEISTVSKT